jgi:hypothetical protein
MLKAVPTTVRTAERPGGSNVRPIGWKQNPVAGRVFVGTLKQT